MEQTVHPGQDEGAQTIPHGLLAIGEVMRQLVD